MATENTSLEKGLIGTWALVLGISCLTVGLRLSAQAYRGKCMSWFFFFFTNGFLWLDILCMSAQYTLFFALPEKGSDESHHLKLYESRDKNEICFTYRCFWCSGFRLLFFFHILSAQFSVKSLHSIWWKIDIIINILFFYQWSSLCIGSLPTPRRL